MPKKKKSPYIKKPPRKDKTPHANLIPSHGKIPTLHGDPVTDTTPLWKFSRLDLQAETLSKLQIPTDINFADFMQIFKHRCNTPWSVINTETHGKKGKSKNHFIRNPVKQFTKLGKELCKKNNIDYEHVENFYSLRCAGTVRLIGIREDRYFYILWYDPNHSIVQSTKRNT